MPPNLRLVLPILVAAGFEYQGRYAQDVRDIGDGAAFACLTAVFLGGEHQGVLKARTYL